MAPIQCTECEAPTVFVKESTIDASTVGSRGEIVTRSTLNDVAGYVVASIWFAFWISLSLFASPTAGELAFMLGMAGIGGAFIWKEFVDGRRRARVHDPVPGRVFRCAKCKFWWTEQDSASVAGTSPQ